MTSRRPDHALRTRIGRDERGVAAVEFALIVPVMILLWLGGVEVTSALSVDRRVHALASSIGDLASRSKSLTYAEVDDIFQIAPGAMFPYSTDGIGLRVTAINVDSAGAAKVAWSRAKGTYSALPIAASAQAMVPDALRVADTQVIMSETSYGYRPTLGYVITGTLPLTDRMFYTPRGVRRVQLCVSALPTSCLS